METETPVPPLRPGIVIEPERSRLVDEALDRRIRLDPRGIEAAQALVEPTTIAGLAHALDTEPEAAARIVASFERLNLLDTPEARALVASAAPMRQVQQAGESEVRLLIRQDAAFDCVMCGSCCLGQNIGPISDEDLRRLHEGWDLVSEKVRSPRGFFFSSGGEEGPGEERVFCYSPRGACVFLSEEGRCMVHGLLGGDRKPAICQIFPFQFVATPDGVAVSLQMECRCYHEARRGRKLSAQQDELRRMLALVPRLGRIPTRLVLEEGQVISWEEWVRLEEELHGAVDASAGDDLATLEALRDAVDALRDESPGGDADGLKAENLRSDLKTFAAELGRVATDLRAACQEGSDEAEHLVRTTSLDALLVALGALRTHADQVLRPLEADGGQALFRDNAHNHLMGKQLLAAPDVVAGLARFTFCWLAVRALMIARSREVRRAHLATQDVTDALGVLTFLFRSGPFLEVLRHCDGTLRSLFFERLPELIEHRRELVSAETRLEHFRA